jgi:hypothetical protein
MIELALVTHLPLDELRSLTEQELATVLDVLQERTRG